MLRSIGLPELVVILAVWAFTAVCYWKITKRTGFKSGLGIVGDYPSFKYHLGHLRGVLKVANRKTAGAVGLGDYNAWAANRIE